MKLLITMMTIIFSMGLMASESSMQKMSEVYDEKVEQIDKRLEVVSKKMNDLTSESKADLENAYNELIDEKNELKSEFKDESGDFKEMTEQQWNELSRDFNKAFVKLNKKIDNLVDS